MRLPALGGRVSPLEPPHPARGPWSLRAGVSSGGSWVGEGLPVGPFSSPPLCRHPEALPGHPHDAGLQAGPVLPGLLAVPVPGHASGNGWERRLLG